MGKTLHVVDCGVQAYRTALEMQEQAAGRRRAGYCGDTLFLLEHPPVYTLGRNALRAHVLADEESLARDGIGLETTTRGGDVAYHGPGQLVVYPILDLGPALRRVVWYVHGLEEVVIRILAEYGLEAERDKRHRGVWLGRKKIAAVGVKVATGIASHGFALNVAVNLDHYSGIVPCGIQGRGVASLHEHVRDASVAEVKRRVPAHFSAVFGYDRIKLSQQGASSEKNGKTGLA